MIEEPAGGDHHGSGGAGDQPLAPGCHRSQPVEQWLVDRGSGATEPAGDEDDVGIGHLGEQLVDVVATPLPGDLAEPRPDADEFDVLELLEHDR